MVGGVAQFSGPWQDDFRKAYSSVQNDAARQILCGGPITSEEIAELNSAYTSCMADAGYADVVMGEYGTLKITTSSSVPSKSTDAADMRCEDESGWYPVVPLYYNMRQNPNKADLNQLIADCLVRVGLEPAGFSGADVAAQYSDNGDAFSGISQDPLFTQCWYNPTATK